MIRESAKVTEMSPGAKQLVVRPDPLPIHLLGRRAQALQDGLGQRQRDFAFARKHLVGAGLMQHVDVAQVGGARQHAQLRVDARATAG